MNKILIVFVTTIVMLNAVGFEATGETQGLKKLKSGSTARTWSIEATLLPVAGGFLVGRYIQPHVGVSLGLAGIVFGPSVGHFYAHEWKRGLISAGVRVAIPAACMVPIILLANVSMEPAFVNWGVITITAISGGALLFYSIVYDIATAPASVRKYNERIEKRGSLQFQPLIDVGKKRIGLSVVYRF